MEHISLVRIQFEILNILIPLMFFETVSVLSFFPSKCINICICDISSRSSTIHVYLTARKLPLEILNLLVPFAFFEKVPISSSLQIKEEEKQNGVILTG